MLRRAAIPLLLRAAGGAGAGAALAPQAAAATAATAAATTSAAAAAAASASLLLRRLYAHMTVVVPPMGDSISEGTVATVLKKPGDSVVENETIAQIETDKVTIDVKAPQDGVVVGFSVKEQDTVVPGQALATVDAGAAAAEAASAASAAATTAAAAAAAAPAPSAAAPNPPPPQEAHGRQPSIRFPPRTTADGRRISDLPAAEAAAAAASSGAGGQAAAPAAKAAPAAAAAAPAAAPAAPAAAPAGSSPTAAFRGSGVVAGARPRARPPVPARELSDRFLSQREMDMIELGGAEPYEKQEKKKKRG